MFQGILKQVIKKNESKSIVVMNDANQATMKEALETVLSFGFTVKARYAHWKKGDIDAMLLGMPAGNLFSKYFRAKRLVNESMYPKLFILEGTHMDLPALKKLFAYEVPLNMVVIDDLTDSQGAGFLASRLSADGYLLVNADKQVNGLSKKTRGHVVTYGFSENAHVRAVNMRVSQDSSYDSWQLRGMKCDILYKGETIPVHIKGLLGREAVYTALASITAGIMHGIDPHEAAKRLESFHPAGGRLRILGGIKHTTLIDDTYGSDYKSAVDGIEFMKEIAPPSDVKKIAVISEITGLGKEASASHRHLGELVADSGFTHFLAVGKHGQDMLDGALEKGMNKEHVYVRPEYEDAGLFLQELMKKGDLVYLDGNEQGKSEYMVKEVMADPLQANTLLARSNEEWKI